MERKFIHECGLCGHIEDICTSENVRGKGMGKWMILQLIQLAKSQKAYKVLLSCQEKNIGFYEKCGLTPKSTTMSVYF